MTFIKKHKKLQLGKKLNVIGKKIKDIWKKNASELLLIDSENHVDSLNASGAAAIGMWELYKNHE